MASPYIPPVMDAPTHRGKPQYPGEDTRLTSTKELAGWYIYGWAAEVFVVCGIGSFIPITLEQLARERGVLASDHSSSCSIVASPVLGNQTITGITSPYITTAKGSQCIIFFLGLEINTASFAMYTFSFSVLIQALVIVSMSGAADHGRFRKTLLLTFAFIGAIATMLFLPVSANVYFIGALLAVIANTCFGASFVLLNSFLPLLVRHHPSLQSSVSSESPQIVAVDQDPEEPPEESDSSDYSTADVAAALLPGNTLGMSQSPGKLPAAASPELQVSTKISSNGIGIGYLGAITVQIISVVIVKLMGGSTFSLRIALFVVGAWWFIFSIPCIFFLRSRPGPPLHNSGQGDKARTWIAYTGHAWLSLGRTIMRARRLKDMLLFLGAWFLLSDAIATVSGTAVLFAKTTLGMQPAALALINVVVMVFGVIGAFMWSTMSRVLGLKPSQTILVCLCVFELIPIYALLGYIPAIQRLGAGLNSPVEMYPLGAVYGLVLGGLSSYCRSLFGELIPHGFEATFYSLYAITDKGSSIFGPAIVGAITDATGEIRPAFWFLAVLIGLPFPLMCLVDVERGKRDGDAMARELEE